MADSWKIVPLVCSTHVELSIMGTSQHPYSIRRSDGLKVQTTCVHVQSARFRAQVLKFGYESGLNT
jgi:hypothetical protein